MPAIEAFSTIERSLAHERQSLLHSEQGPTHVDAESLVEVGLRYRTQRGEFAEAGIREEDIQTAFRLLDLLVQPIKIGQVRDVALDPLGVRPDRSDRRLEFCRTSSCDENEGSLFGEELCGCQSYAAGPARY